jgi:hypothetical protein
MQRPARHVGRNPDLSEQLLGQAHEDGREVRGEDGCRVIAGLLTRRDVQNVRGDGRRQPLRDLPCRLIAVDPDPGTAKRLWRVLRVREGNQRVKGATRVTGAPQRGEPLRIGAPARVEDDCARTDRCRRQRGERALELGIAHRDQDAGRRT